MNGEEEAERRVEDVVRIGGREERWRNKGMERKGKGEMNGGREEEKGKEGWVEGVNRREEGG